jgi:hypothetical protein
LKTYFCAEICTDDFSCLKNQAQIVRIIQKKLYRLCASVVQKFLKEIMAKSKKQKIVAGNWKMNTTLSSAITLALVRTRNFCVESRQNH